MDENAILVVNKSDLLKEDLSFEITNFEHVLISVKNNLNVEDLILKIKNKLKINLSQVKIYLLLVKGTDNILNKA